MNPKVIDDDAECIRILREEGLLEKFRPTPPFDKASTLFERDGHYCYATIDIDHEDPKDNGYLIVMVPMEETSRENATAFFQILEIATARIPVFCVKPLEW